MVFSSVTCLKLFLQGMKEQSKVYIAILNTLAFFTCLLYSLRKPSSLLLQISSVHLFTVVVDAPSPVWNLHLLVV